MVVTACLHVHARNLCVKVISSFRVGLPTASAACHNPRHRTTPNSHSFHPRACSALAMKSECAWCGWVEMGLGVCVFVWRETELYLCACICVCVFLTPLTNISTHVPCSSLVLTLGSLCIVTSHPPPRFLFSQTDVLGPWKYRPRQPDERCSVRLQGLCCCCGCLDRTSHGELYQGHACT